VARNDSRSRESEVYSRSIERL